MSTQVAELLEAEEFAAAAAAFTAEPSAQAAELLFDALDQIDRDEGMEPLEHSLVLAQALIARRPTRDDAHLVAIECLRKLGRTDEVLELARAPPPRPAGRGSR